MRLIAYHPIVRSTAPIGSFSAPSGHFTPRANVLKKEHAFEIQLAVPGFAKSDFEVRLEDGLLEISGKREGAGEANYTRREFEVRSFNRRFSIPQKIEVSKIEARYEDGILRVTLPLEPPRRVEIA